jgi:glutaconate CoA-transferase subunit B
VDRYGNLNSTVIGPYDAPKTRLPGAGGATEIAAHARQTFVMLKATRRSLVAKLDFRTSAGFLEGNGARARTTMRGTGPQSVITDYGVLQPHPETDELQLSALFDGIAVDEARAATGWPLKVAATVATIAPPTPVELETLRALHVRTREAHSRPVRLPA